jgi:hypothetical protein
VATSHSALTATTQPRRDDDVAAWIKARRDAYYGIGRKYRDAWQAMDDLLDEWRLLADTGRTVAEALTEAP